MLRTHFTYRRTVFAGLAVLLVMSASLAWGYEERARGRGRQDAPEDSRKEQLRQEAQASATEIKTMLTDILERVNKNHDPEAAVIEKAATLLEDNKRFAVAYDEDQKAEYMLLQAWTDFYQGNSLGAMNWSLRACKTDPASQDGWISQALFSLLNGKRPMEPRIQGPESRPERTPERDVNTNRRPRPRPRANMTANNENRQADVDPYSQKGTLDFDLLALRTDMLKERFSRVTYKSANGSAVEYKPGENTLCALFWQGESIASDANDVTIHPPVGRARQEAGMTAARGNGSNPQVTLEDQQKYLDHIFTACKGKPAITCLQLNTNDRKTAEYLARERAKTGSGDTPPLVFAATADSGASNYIGFSAQTPFLLIADDKGVVRYAGPAADFMPAFILTHLTGVKIPLDGANQTAPGDRMVMPRGRELEPAVPGRRSVTEPRQLVRNTVVDPNKPAAADPNAVSATPVRPSRPAEKPEVKLEEEVAAEKLLALAQMEIEASRTIRGKSPEKGIDACKEVLEKYPGTPYAEQARDQLRRVPERYWEKYGIADLLGY